MSLEEYLRKNSFVKALVKGPSGIGKTVFAAQASHVWKTMYVDTDGGIISALKKSVKRDNIDIRILRDPNHEGFLSKLGDCVAEAEAGNFECFVMDHITEVASRIEEQLAGQDLDGFEKYRKLLERLMRFSRLMRDLPCHTIVTGHTKPTGKEDSTSIFELAINGQSSGIIPGYFDVVGLVQKKTEKGAKSRYVFTTSGPSLLQVRDRWRALEAEEPIDESRPGAIWTKLQKGMEDTIGKETAPQTA
jgi:hypothetical protein